MFVNRNRDATDVLASRYLTINEGEADTLHPCFCFYARLWRQGTPLPGRSRFDPCKPASSHFLPGLCLRKKFSHWLLPTARWTFITNCLNRNNNERTQAHPRASYYALKRVWVDTLGLLRSRSICLQLTLTGTGGTFSSFPTRVSRPWQVQILRVGFVSLSTWLLSMPV